MDPPGFEFLFTIISTIVIFLAAITFIYYVMQRFDLFDDQHKNNTDKQDKSSIGQKETHEDWDNHYDGVFKG